jgi:histidyl-tRNA synthetase
MDLLDVSYVINPGLVRGLDYYTKTAFEVTSESLGSQNSVAAGGRYDSLVEEFGGPPNPGFGFAIGIERIIRLLKDSFSEKIGPDLFICTLSNEASEKSIVIARHLRAGGLSVEVNYTGSSLKSQMRKANRVNAKNVIIIGEDELARGETVVREMNTGKDQKTSMEPDALLNILL